MPSEENFSTSYFRCLVCPFLKFCHYLMFPTLLTFVYPFYPFHYQQGLFHYSCFINRTEGQHASFYYAYQNTIVSCRRLVKLLLVGELNFASTKKTILS